MVEFNLSDPVVRSLIMNGTIVTVKMILMSFLTARMRFKKRIFSSKEDTVSLKGSKVVYDDQDIERIRRNHLNDLENIPAFILTALLYTMTSPAPYVAIWHFRAFTISRILHTISYQLPLPQPARALTWTVGVVATLSMAAQTLMAVW